MIPCVHNFSHCHTVENLEQLKKYLRESTFSEVTSHYYWLCLSLHLGKGNRSTGLCLTGGWPTLESGQDWFSPWVAFCLWVAYSRRWRLWRRSWCCLSWFPRKSQGWLNWVNCKVAISESFHSIASHFAVEGATQPQKWHPPSLVVPIRFLTAWVTSEQWRHKTLLRVLIALISLTSMPYFYLIFFGQA